MSADTTAIKVQGPDTLPGNPIAAALYGKVTSPGDTPVLSDATGNLRITVYNGTTAVGVGTGILAADGLGTGSFGGAMAVANLPFDHNGTSWDRRRNNVEATALASAARTSSTNSADQVNYNGRGVQVVLDVTAASGTGGLTVRIQGKDPVTGKYYNLNAAPTAITATGTYVYTLSPGESNAASGDVQQRTAGALPRTWRVSVTHGDGSSYTYSVGVVTLL